MTERCEKCGCQLMDPFSGKIQIHFPERCGGIVHLGECPHCGSEKEPWFSRCEPMGYHCQDCGKDVDDDSPNTEITGRETGKEHYGR